LEIIGRQAKLSEVKAKLAWQAPQMSATVDGLWQLAILIEAVLLAHEFPWRKNPLLHPRQVVVELDVE